MPEQFHQYNLIKTLNKKYSHATYLASPINDPKRQTVLTVFVASLFSSPLEREKLLQKAQHLKKLSNEYLASIQDVGIEKEQPFVAREYLPNDSLRSRLNQLSPGRLDLHDALTLILQAGEILANAHAQGLTHGSIKPENIFFDANDHVILTDFYLIDRKDAIIRDQASEEYAFCYLAPEQFAGICDAKSDQYALGCLAYELITGQLPFAIQSLASMMGQPSNAAPAPLSESVDNLPPSLETAVLKALAKDPDERFFDFSLFLEVIQTILSPSPAFPLMRSSHSHKKKTVPHSVQSAQDAPHPISPIRKRASKRTTSQTLEPSIATSSAQVDSAQDSSSPVFPIQKHVTDPTASQILEPSIATSSAQVDSAQDIPSPAFPIQMRVTEPTILQTLDLSTTPSNTEVDLAEAVNTTSLSQTSMSEWAGIIPISESLAEALSLPSTDGDLIVKEDTQPHTGDLLEADTLVQEDVATANEETLAFIKSPDKVRNQSVRPLHSRIKILGLAILLAGFVFAITSSSWLPRSSTRDTSPSTTTVTRIMQVATTIQTQNMSTVQPSAQAQAMHTPTVQSSAQAMHTPTIQSSASAQSSSSTPASASAPAPAPIAQSKPAPSKPAPTPTPAEDYQADASQNTLTNGAVIVGCSECSDGHRVGYIGLNGSSDGMLQFNDVTKNIAGQYKLTIYYIIAGSDKPTTYISVNGGSAVALNVPDTPNGTTVGTANTTISLKAGNNTIQFSNPSNPAPDMDRIVV